MIWTDDEAATIARRIEVLLRAKQFGRAHQAIDEAELLEHAAEPRGPEVCLGDLNISPRVLGALERAGVFTIRELLAKTPAELLSLSVVGETTLASLQALAAEHVRTS